MSKIERVVVSILFVLSVVMADSTLRRAKTLERKWSAIESDNSLGKLALHVQDAFYRLKKLEKHQDAHNLQAEDAIIDLQQRTGNLEDSKCSCPAPKPCSCPAASPCTCCPPKKAESKPGAASKFCRWHMIQIDGERKRVWFKWYDTDGVLHETRMTLAEFEAWDSNDK